MRTLSIIKCGILLILLALLPAVHADAQKRELKACLYPYIPDADMYYKKIESLFEKQYPDIDLQIEIEDGRSGTIEYYHGGLYATQADVLEIDCIFLDSLIRKNSVMAYPDQNFLKARTDTMNYDGIAYHDGTLYVLPHWICGNFLFYHKEDAAIRNATYLNELEKALGIDSKALTTDLSGGLTGGEMYADGLYDDKGNKADVGIALQQEKPDVTTVNNMRRLLHLTDTVYSLSSDSSTARIEGFVKGKFRVHVGYAESSNEILKAINKRTGVRLKPTDIAIRDWPLSDKGSHPLGWVDALGIKAGLSGQKLTDAQDFINFLLSDTGYLNALIPDANQVPRYLLPAYKRYYQNQAVLEKAPLYRYFLPLAEDMKPLKLPKMNNEKLRKTGGEVMEEIRKPEK